MDIKEAKNATQKDIDGIRSALELFPRVAQIVRRFDGKVYNKRFNTAIMAAFPDGKVFSHISSYGQWIEVYYLHKYSHNFYFLRIQLDKLQNKRIDAKMFEENMKFRMFDLWKELHALERCLQTCEEDLQRLESIELELRVIASRFPYTTREYFRPALYLRT